MLKCFDHPLSNFEPFFTKVFFVNDLLKFWTAGLVTQEKMNEGRTRQYVMPLVTQEKNNEAVHVSMFRIGI